MAMTAKNHSRNCLFLPAHRRFEIGRNGIRWNETERTFDAIDPWACVQIYTNYDILIIGASTGSASCTHCTFDEHEKVRIVHHVMFIWQAFATFVLQYSYDFFNSYLAA